MSFAPPVRVRPPGSGFKAPIVKSQQTNPETIKNPDLSDKIRPEKKDPDNFKQNDVESKSVSSQDAVVPSSQTLFPALRSSCEVTYFDEMPFEMSQEYFDAGVNVAEKFGVIVVNGVVQEISSSQSSLQSQTADKSQNATLSQDWITKKLVPKSQDNLVSTQNVEDVDELFSSSQDNAIDEVFTSTENVSNVDYVAATYDDVPASKKVNFASLLLTEEANDDEDVTDFLMPTQEDNRVESSVRYDDVVQESMSILDEGKQLTQSTENPVEHDAQEFDHSVDLDFIESKDDNSEDASSQRLETPFLSLTSGKEVLRIAPTEQAVTAKSFAAPKILENQNCQIDTEKEVNLGKVKGPKKPKEKKEGDKTTKETKEDAATSDTVAAIKATKVKAPKKPKEKKEGEKVAKKPKKDAPNNSDTAIKATKVKSPRKPKEKKDQSAKNNDKEATIPSCKGDSTALRTGSEDTASSKPIKKADGPIFAKKSVVNEITLVTLNICDSIIQEIVANSLTLSQSRTSDKWTEKAPKKKRVAKEYEKPPSDSNQKRRRVESSKDRLRLLQKLRQDDGTWVECCLSTCGKWRYLADVKDPALVPEFWTCENNTDKEYSSCEAPQQTYRLEQMVMCHYTAGSVVWARQTGYPWWPGMIDDCPDTETFFWPDDSTYEYPKWYHVTFFDHFKMSVFRAWIPTDSIRPFYPGKEAPSGMSAGRMSSRLDKSVKQAETAFQMDVVERRKKFSFLSRYTGHWGTALDDESEEES